MSSCQTTLNSKTPASSYGNGFILT